MYIHPKNPLTLNFVREYCCKEKNLKPNYEGNFEISHTNFGYQKLLQRSSQNSNIARSYLKTTRVPAEPRLHKQVNVKYVDPNA